MSVEFFRFVRGSETWRFSSLAESIAAGGSTWLPAPIQRGEVDVSTEIDKSTVTISVARDFPPAAIFAATAPRSPTYVTLYRADLSDIAGTFGALWHGQISGVQWQGSYAEIQCQPALALLSRPSPRKRYSSSCRWALYDSGCRVGRNAATNFRLGQIIDVQTQTRIVISTVQSVDDPENWARGGTLQITSAPGSAIETIISSTATTIVGAERERVIELARPMEAMGSFEDIRIQRGCGHRFTDCAEFNNTARYGGFPYLPDELAP
jgi:hypothetical protein